MAVDGWAWPSALGLAALSLALGIPLVAVAATGDHLEYPLVAAALRAAWIGLYVAMGLAFARRRSHRLLGLTMTACAAVAAIASTDVLPGSAAYTFSRAVAPAIVPPFVLMLTAIPEARAVRTRVWPLALASIPLVLLISAGRLMVAPDGPWAQAASQCAGPCPASAIQVTDAPAAAHGLVIAGTAVLVSVLAAAVAITFREGRRVSPMTGRSLRSVGWLIAVWGGALSVGLVAVAIDPAPGRLGPYLVATSAIRAALPVALLVVVLQRASRTGAVRDELTARLARADAPATVERAIADVLGDPSLRLAFRDRGWWIDVDGAPIEVNDPPAARGRLFLDDEETVALVFDAALEAHEQRMHAVAGLGAAALERARTEAELRAVRRRLAEVAEQERTRIGRNLHDGAQQRLVAMAVRVGVARETLADRPELVAPLLREFAADLQRALDELRELAHSLYPAVLTDHGLAEALRSLARRAPSPVDTAIADVGRLDPLTEAAVYFCCSEALQNAAKHAGRNPVVTLRLWRNGDGVEFEVTDDGPGLPAGAASAGTGLAGMRDRIQGVGGTLTIASAPGAGTTARGRVPG